MAHLRGMVKVGDSAHFPSNNFWLSLLTGSKEMDEMPDWAKGDKAYEAYFEASTRANFTPEETIQYEKDMMTERDRIDTKTIASCTGLTKEEVESL